MFYYYMKENLKYSKKKYFGIIKKKQHIFLHKSRNQDLNDHCWGLNMEKKTSTAAYIRKLVIFGSFLRDIWDLSPATARLWITWHASLIKKGTWHVRGAKWEFGHRSFPLAQERLQGLTHEPGKANAVLLLGAPGHRASEPSVTFSWYLSAFPVPLWGARIFSRDWKQRVFRSWGYKLGLCLDDL